MGIFIQGQRRNLTETEGIDILGNTIENSLLSSNRNLYGDIHNMGHIMLAYVHDPDNRYLVRKKLHIRPFYLPLPAISYNAGTFFLSYLGKFRSNG